MAFMNGPAKIGNLPACTIYEEGGWPARRANEEKRVDCRVVSAFGTVVPVNLKLKRLRCLEAMFLRFCQLEFHWFVLFLRGFIFTVGKVPRS